MKVLLIHNYYRSSAPSGEDAVARGERKLLEEHGVEVVCYEKMNDAIDDSTPLKRIALGLNTIWSRRSAGELTELLRRERPDLAHVHSLHPQISPSAYAACHRAGVPVVHTLHNYRYLCPGALLHRDGRPCEDCLGHWPLHALRHRCYRGSLLSTGAVVGMICWHRLAGTFSTGVDRFIALTEFAKSRLVLGGLPAERIAVKPNFSPWIPPPGEVRRGGYAVYVGRLSEEGLRTLLAAWRQVRGLSLKIVGAGYLRGELESLAAELGVKVEFLGGQPRERVLDLIGGAALQVVPSEWYEGFPMVVLEAYACGTPVVASRIGSLSEVVSDGATGLLFQAGDPDDLAAKVNALAREPQRARTMGEACRRRYQESYTPEQNLRQLLQVYREARLSFDRRER